MAQINLKHFLQVIVPQFFFACRVFALARSILSYNSVLPSTISTLENFGMQESTLQNTAKRRWDLRAFPL